MINEKSISTLEDFDLVVFGSTGDLSYRKIFPALYHRLKEGQVKPKSRIAAIVRDASAISDFKNKLKKSLTSTIENVDTKILEDLLSKVKAVEANVENGKYTSLSNWFSKSSNKVNVYYLATPSSVFGFIASTLDKSNLINDQSRIVLEKPLGKDAASSNSINNEILKYFKEEQIYRIDHYLGKETVQNIMVLRFANNLFEHSWNSNHIKNIQITAAEKIGVEKRGDYYDNYGALLDMVQNHLLQLLCLIAMEPPTILNAEEVRNEKLKVLRSLRKYSKENIDKRTVKGQYTRGNVNGKQLPSYLEDIGKYDSETETFVALKSYVDNWRWKGVPFYIRTGKCLTEKFSEIKYKKPLKKALQSDTIIAICMQRDPKESIPEWEEIASIGAAVQNMYLTCSAYNIGCYWSSPEAIKHLNGYLNLKIGERCLGFLYMGYHEMPSIKGMRRSIAEKIEWF